MPPCLAQKHGTLQPPRDVYSPSKPWVLNFNVRAFSVTVRTRVSLLARLHRRPVGGLPGFDLAGRNLRFDEEPWTVRR